MADEMRNILILGIGFMLVFTAFKTMENIEQTVIKSAVNEENPTFEGNGYTSLGIIYVLFALCNWITPSILHKIGAKRTMLIGAVTYLLFIISFYHLTTWSLYIASALLGAGAAFLWAGQGTYLTKISSSETITRNSGIFWALQKSSLFLGNIFVYFQFHGKLHIDLQTRYTIYTFLSFVCLVGIFILLKLQTFEEKSSLTTFDALKSAAKLFVTKDVLLLNCFFLYSGVLIAFAFGVYGACIGFTMIFGENAKQLVGLSGIFIGLGEVAGGTAFGLLGNRTIKYGRSLVIIFGILIQFSAFVMIYINIPNLAPIGETYEFPHLNPPSKIIAILCSFLLGFGDACNNTQIIAMLGSNYANESAAIFSIFRFTQSLGSAISFGYTTLAFNLHTHLNILMTLGTLGTACFAYVESTKIIFRPSKRYVMVQCDVKNSKVIYPG